MKSVESKIEYDGKNLKQYIEYLDIINSKIEEKISKNLPIVEGEWEQNYYRRNKELELNLEGIEINKLSEEMAEFFNGVIRWIHPYAFHNVKTPTNIFAVAVATMTMLYDPNLAEDKNCGNMANSEIEVIKYMAQIAGWNTDNASGYFTFGGTSTLLNAVKIGLCKVKQDSPYIGVDNSLFIICSELEHHSIDKVCNWLGIGKEGCIKIDTDSDYQLDIDKAETEIEKNIFLGKKLAAIIVCGGTTVQSIIDPIQEIINLRSRIIQKYDLEYIPHIHVDSVVTWPILFFKDYNFSNNINNFHQDALYIIEKMYNELKSIQKVDSFGVDFHKTGFCPFSSSLFMVKEKKDMFLMNGLSKEIADDISFGEYTTADYVLESSRSLCGPMSSIAMLKSLGIDGLREKYCTMTHWGLYLRKKLMELHEFEVINPPTFGICVLFVVSGESFRYKFEEIEKMNMTKCYRFAKYNYDFYLYCLMKSKEYKILLEYSSGYSHRNSKVFMGVLKLQSFTTSLNKILIDEFVERLNYLKKNFDKEKKTLRLVTPSNARSFKFAYNKTEKDC